MYLSFTDVSFSITLHYQSLQKNTKCLSNVFLKHYGIGTLLTVTSNVKIVKVSNIGQLSK